MDRKRELLIRAYLVLFLFIVYALVIIWKIFNISVIEGDKWREKGGDNVKWMKVEADRGNIFDKNGNLLATSLPFFEIRMDLLVPRQDLFDREIDSLAISLANFFPEGKSSYEWRSEMITARKDGKAGKKSGSRYHFIKRNLTFDQVDIIRDFPLFRHGRNSGGIIVERTTKRDKPFNDLAARTIGMYRSNASNIGLEGSFDKYLRGASQQKLMKRVPPGYWIPVYEPEELEETKGDDIVTTLDIRFQDIVQEELHIALKTFSAKKGTAILMEVETGAIAAISNLEQSGGDYRELYNHAIGTLSEPGSTMKLASTLALIEDNFADLQTRVNLHGGKKKFYDRWMYDSEPHGIYESTLKQAFIKSSNVGIASLAHKAYGKKNKRQMFTNKLVKFGLSEKTGIEIIGEGKPYLKDPVQDHKVWYGTTVPWMAHGYEMTLTPLQVLNFYNTIANDGTRMKPYIVSEVMSEGKVVKTIKPKIVDGAIASKKSIDKVKFLLEETVTAGTARKANSSKVRIAAKTGTTRVEYYKKTKTKKYNGSLAGYFPADNPKYSLIIVVYEPKETFYGGAVAGKAFRKIAERIVGLQLELQDFAHLDRNDKPMPYKHASLGYGPDFQNVMDYLKLGYTKETKSNWVSVSPDGKSLVVKKNKISNSKVPDVRGMGLRDAIYVLENIGLTVDINGVGKVHAQSILPGTKIKGQEIEIFLN